MNIDSPSFNTIILCVLLATISTRTYAQSDSQGVGIGTSDPDKTAVLHVDSETNTKGLLIPRFRTAEPNNDLDNITDPADGLLVYDLDRKGLVYYDKSLEEWVEVTPQGMITMWSGTTPPNGWALCDGNNNTPDLSGRFIVAYDATPAAGTNYGTIGNIGGSNTVQLTANQSGLREHTHNASSSPAGGHDHDIPNGIIKEAQSITFNRGSSGGRAIESPVHNFDQTLTTDSEPNHSHGITVQDVNASNAIEAHENRPPYYVLAFIMKR